jgi:hypothetical protein
MFGQVKSKKKRNVESGENNFEKEGNALFEFVECDLNGGRKR